MKLKAFLFFVLGLSFAATGCSTVASLAGATEKCVVIARRAQLRSSGAVVAADILEVQRGTKLEIIGEENFEATSSTLEKWYNVRASDENNTEGWIEARNVLLEKLLEKSKQNFEESKAVPTQASGQLRAASNLRLSPERTSDDNILQKLNGGDTFEIIGWQRVPKPADAEEDKDDAPKTVANVQVKPSNKPKKEDLGRLDDKYDTWYKVRLDAAVSPAPFGWVYGKQVELTVPSDIIFYRTGREFVAWSRLDGDAEGNNVSAYQQGTKDAAKEGKPGSWVILERSNKILEPGGEEPDFDHIFIIGYDKYNQDHYRVYLSGNLKGFLPLRVTGGGDSRAFTVTAKDQNGEKRDYTFSTYKDARGFLKVNVPPDIPKDEVKK